MSHPYVAALASLLIWAGVAFGQSQDAASPPALTSWQGLLEATRLGPIAFSGSTPLEAIGPCPFKEIRFRPIEVFKPMLIEDALLNQINEAVFTQAKEAEPIEVKEKSRIQLKETAPVQPKQTAPIQLKEAAPVQPKQTAPIQLEEAAPVQPKQTAPIQLKEVASVQPKQAAPINVSEAFLPSSWSYVDEFIASGHTGVFSADAEYLLWLLANSRNNIPAAASAPLAQSGSSPLASLGDAEHSNRAPIAGARIALGYWTLEQNPWVTGGIRDLGVEASFFFVGQRSVDSLSDLAPSMVRPFFDFNNRQESGFVVAAPGVATGSVATSAKIGVWGAEANIWKSIYHDYPGTVQGLSIMGGFRYLSADYTDQVSSFSAYSPNLAATSPFFPLAGNTLAIQDSFSTHNRFYGGQVGIAGKAWLAPSVLLQGTFKVAVGVTSEDLDIAGSQLRTSAAGQTQAYSGGILALPANSGHFGQSKFTQVPELDLKVSWRITDHLSISTGFSALYWNRVARGANQIDRELDITQIPNFQVPAGTPPANLGHPSVPFQQSDLWIMGLSVGVEVNW